MFLAQVFGGDEPGSQAIVLVMTVLTAISAGAIQRLDPAARDGVEMVNVPGEGIALVLGVDRSRHGAHGAQRD
jgi:Na+/H+-dicarboxylate symporter